LLKEEKIILQGKAIFIDTSAPSKVMLSSSLSFAILILESLLDGQPTTLSLPQKTNILLRALKKGLNVSLNYLDVLSTLEGGLVFGEPTARDDGFIDHLPSTTLSPYKLVLIHLPLSPYLSSKSQQLWMKSFSSYRIMLQAPSLRLLNYEETLLQATKLTMQYGEKTMAPVFYFQEQQNRTKLAYFGLKKLNENPNNGLKSLIEWANLEEKNITISDVVFSLGPRINAPGRMAHAKASVEILISEDPSIGRKMAESLNLVNDKRRATDELMTSEALESIALDLNIGDKKTIVLHHPDWHKGVVGIVASRLVEKFYRPTIIFSETDGVLTGSARSIKGYSIYQGIKTCEHLVNQFGGHDFAAGVSMPKANFEEFVKTFENEASKIITNEMLVPEIEIDAELLFSEVTMSFFNILNRMAPFGPHNMQPVFITKNLKDAGGTKIVGKNHIRFHLKDDTGKTFNGICFGLADWYQIDDIKRNPIDICYSIQENHYNGKVTLDLMIKDIKIID
jgi:hypothetical protein